METQIDFISADLRSLANRFLGCLVRYAAKELDYSHHSHMDERNVSPHAHAAPSDTLKVLEILAQGRLGELAS